MPTKERTAGKRPRAAREPAVTDSTAAHAAGGRTTTINDIARLSGVSKKTVSRVINASPLVHAETRAKVEAVIRRMRFVPDPQARGLAFRKSFLIGLVYDNPNAQYIVNAQQGVLDALRGSDYELVVHPCDRLSAELIPGVRRFVERQKLRGVILLPPLSENAALLSTLRDLDCAYVRVTYGVADEPGSMVTSNDRVAVGEAARYLTSLGHRTIGYIAGPSGYRSAVERLEGFAAALADRGCQLDRNLVVEGGYTYESGVTCAQALLQRSPRPTAIFASNDEMAAGVYRAAYNLGLSIPQDLSVVGFDDGPIAARLLPSLTTIRLPIRDMYRVAATKLVTPDLAAEPRLVANSLVMPHLVVRDSCGPPHS
jgi:LacI family transcriptional regulator